LSWARGAAAPGAVKPARPRAEAARGGLYS